jgi:hypothetical protein
VLSIDSTVALSWLTLDELGYSDENKEKDKKEEVRDEGSSKESLRESGGRIDIK